MKINFQFNTPYGFFSDALYFEDDSVPSDDVIENMKQERLNNWLTIITATQPIPDISDIKHRIENMIKGE